jgi:hypothetical protein
MLTVAVGIAVMFAGVSALLDDWQRWWSLSADEVEATVVRILLNSLSNPYIFCTEFHAISLK